MCFSVVQSQSTTATFHTVADLSIGNGTGGDIGDAKDRNFGAGGSLMITNYDSYVGYMSPFESWVKFDLTTLEDSIPDGQSIIYAEYRYMISNNTGNGFICYHLKDIDDWVEGNGSSGSLDDAGGLTWTEAQAYDYENPDNYTLLRTDHAVEKQGVSYKGGFNIIDAVNHEMGDDGNKILTLRFAPTISDPDADKKWLGLYAREAPWGVIMEDGVNAAAGHIIFHIGPPQPTEFSDIEGFGDINNYALTPEGFQRWAVSEDEADDRLVIVERPGPINGTLGGLAIYKDATYGDFDITVKAKLDKEKDGGLDPKADFAIIFGHKGFQDYQYMLFTGEEKNGFYTTDTTDGGMKTEVGDINTTPAVADMAYHDYQLVRAGTTVTAYIDGVEYMSVTDDELGVEGGIGIGSYNDVALFDDFVEGGGGIIEPGAVNDRNQASFAFYPNPAEDQINIHAERDIQKLLITNILGQEILTMDNILSTSISIDISGFETGLYFITVEGMDSRPTTIKLLKK